MVWVKRVTRWWNNLFFVLAAVLLPACKPDLGVPLGKICTLAGCVGGISIDITGISLTNGYKVNLIFPNGEMMAMVCDESSEDGFEKSCHGSGAFFALPSDVEPPVTVTVEIIANGVTHRQEFVPAYEIFHPNGEDCPPVCYNSTLAFQVTK